MAVTKANTYEKQAIWSLACASVGVAAGLATAVLLLYKLDFEAFTVQIPRHGRAFPMMLAGVGVACLFGVVAFVVGFSSAGHSRNKHSNLSWMGFFLGAVAVALGFASITFYYFTKFDF